MYLYGLPVDHYLSLNKQFEFIIQISKSVGELGVSAILDSLLKSAPFNYIKS